MTIDSERDGPVRIIEDMAYEIRSWDYDRGVSAEQLAMNLFDIATGVIGDVVSD